MAALMAIGGVGCSTPAPDDVVEDFYAEALSYRQRPDSARLDALIERLDGASRAALEARVVAATTRLGVDVPPAELWSVRGLSAGARVEDTELISASDDRATVEVRFAYAVPTSLGGPDAAPPPARVDLRREGGAWRVVLPLGGQTGEAPR